jgi:hypothetical protein
MRHALCGRETTKKKEQERTTKEEKKTTNNQRKTSVNLLASGNNGEGNEQVPKKFTTMSIIVCEFTDEEVRVTGRGDDDDDKGVVRFRFFKFLEQI